MFEFRRYKLFRRRRSGLPFASMSLEWIFRINRVKASLNEGDKKVVVESSAAPI
jgi:hypothetical protein